MNVNVPFKEKYLGRIVGVIEDELDKIFLYDGYDIDFEVAKYDIIIEKTRDMILEIKQLENKDE